MGESVFFDLLVDVMGKDGAERELAASSPLPGRGVRVPVGESLDAQLRAYAKDSTSVQMTRQELRSVMGRCVRPAVRASRGRRVVAQVSPAAASGSSGDGSRPRPDAVALAADLLAAAGVSR